MEQRKTLEGEASGRTISSSPRGYHHGSFQSPPRSGSVATVGSFRTKRPPRLPPLPATSTPVASNVKAVDKVSGDAAALRFAAGDDGSLSDDGSSVETGDRVVPERKMPENVPKSSLFVLRSTSLTKSSRLVRFSSDNAHIFHQVFDDSESASASSDEDSDESTSLFEEAPSQSEFLVPIVRGPTNANRGGFIRKAFVGLAKAVQRSPPDSPVLARELNGEGGDTGDGSICEFSHSLSHTNLASLAREFREQTAGESHPLLGSERSLNISSLEANGNGSVDGEAPRRLQLSKEEEKVTRIAAAFLMDFEKGRVCSLPEQVQFITESQLWCHRLRFHSGWKMALYLAAFSLFLASNFEGNKSTNQRKSKLAFFTFVPMFIFVVDILLRRHFGILILPDDDRATHSGHGVMRSEFNVMSVVHTRKSRSGQWQWPLLLLFFSLSLETGLFIFSTYEGTFLSSAFKPIVLFYISSNARDALEALRRVAPVVLRVIIMELFIILSFAAVANHTYTTSASFDDLSKSFVSLYELSTTVVNPSLWMPLYNERRSAAIFFIFFVVTSVFYLHSLVLSVVFQTYIQAVREIRDRSYSDRQDALMLAFMTLEKFQANGEQAFPAVRTSTIGRTLALVRPHYSSKKINTLSRILDPNGTGLVDYDTFRTKMPKALSTSLRTAKRPSMVGGISFELFAAVIALSNLIYVMMVSVSRESEWWVAAEFSFGLTLTLLGLLEVLVRLYSASLPFSVPTRIDRVFDGLALLAAVVSGYGILIQITKVHNPLHIEFLLTGRAIDMMRVMRYFAIVRSYVRRSAEVIPAISGPAILVVSAMHVFTYVGIVLWGGAVEVGANKGMISPFYDLNNFNSYASGFVTMFQVLVVNDWHAIAEVYLHAKRCSAPAIVYSFFIGANSISVSILLNVMTAFFVGAFVTRLDGSMSDKKESSALQRSDDLNDQSNFHVSERQGFDKIIETVAGDNIEDSTLVRRTSEIIEIYESLTPGVERVGHLVCCSQSEDRFGNRRFQAMTKEFFSEDYMHMVVSDMHSELISSLARTGSAKESNAQRKFGGSSKELELSASLISTKPPVSLFISRVRHYQQPLEEHLSSVNGL